MSPPLPRPPTRVALTVLVGLTLGVAVNSVGLTLVVSLLLGVEVDSVGLTLVLGLPVVVLLVLVVGDWVWWPPVEVAVEL